MFYSRFGRTRVQIHTGDVMMTKQSHKDECDINNILSQYQRTGIITHVQSAQASFQDLPDEVDFQLALNTLNNAEMAFSSLPSTVRDFFGNDPGRFLGAFNDPALRPKLEEFGFVTPKPVPASAPPDAPST